jgi:hypothetical protein
LPLSQDDGVFVMSARLGAGDPPAASGRCRGGGGRAGRDAAVHLGAGAKRIRNKVAAGKTGKERVYLKDVDPAVTDQAWDRFLAALEPSA